MSAGGVNLATAYVQLVASAKGIQGSIAEELDGPVSSAASSAGTEAGKRFGSGFTGMLKSVAKNAVSIVGGIALYQGLGKGFDLAKGAVFDFNSQLQNANIGFTTMLGSGQKAQSFLNDLQQFAKSTPFDFGGLVNSSQTLLGMGVSAKDIIPTLTALGDSVASVGGSSDQLNNVILAFGQTMAKGTLDMGNMNQLLQGGVPNALKILAAQYHVTTGAMVKMISTGKVQSDQALPLLVQGLEKGTSATAALGGMMDKQSVTFSGALGNIGDTLNQTIAGAFKPFFDVTTKGLLAFGNLLASDKVSAWTASTAKSLSSFIANTSKIGPALKAGFNNEAIKNASTMQKAFKAAGDGAYWIYAGVTSAAGAIKAGFAGSTFNAGSNPVIKFLKDIGNAAYIAQSGVQTALGAIKAGFSGNANFLKGANPVIQALYSIGQVASTIDFKGIFGNVLAALKPIASTVGSVLSGIVKQIGPTLSAVVSAAGPLLSAIGQTLGSVFKAVGPALSQLGPQLAPLLKFMTPFGAVTQILLPILPQIAKALGDMAKTIGGALIKVLPTIAKLIGTLAKTLSGTLAKILPTIAKLIGTVAGVLSGALAKVLPTIADLLSTVADVLGGAIAAILPTVAKLVDTLSGALSKVLPPIIQLAGLILGSLAQALVRILPPIGTLIGQIGTGLGQAIVALMPMITALVGAITKLVPSVLGVVEAFLPLVPVVLKLVGVVVSLLPPLAKLISAILPPLIGFVVKADQAFYALYTTYIKFVVGMISGLVSGLSGLIGWFGDTGKHLTDLGGMFKDIWGKIKTTVSSGVSDVVGFFTGLPGKAGNALKGLGSTIAGAFTGMWKTVKSNVTEGVQWVVDAITGLPGKLINLAESFLIAGGTLMANILDGISNGIQDVAGFVANVAGQVWNAIAGFINDKFIEPIKGFGISILGHGLHPFSALPDVPTVKLADGGFLAAGQSAIVGEFGRELITPAVDSYVTPNGPAEDALSGKGNGVTFNVNNYGPGFNTAKVMSDLNLAYKAGRVPA